MRIKAEQKKANLPADDSHQFAKLEGLKAMDRKALDKEVRKNN